MSGSASLSLAYDPLGRLRSTAAGGTTTEFLYDGDRLVAEYVGGTLQRRYAHGAGVDEPLVWYEGAGTSDRRWLVADQLGSVIASTDASGTTTRYTYGPYGEPASWTGARFRYTGQAALPEAQLYHYKARVYDPVLGRFLQVDPVGYEDDLHLYSYVHDDPIRAGDPSGLESPCISLNRDCFGGDTTEEDAARVGEQMGAVADWLPGIGDMKGAWEFTQNPSVISGIGVVVGLIPGVPNLGPATRNLDEAADAAAGTLRPGPYARESIPARGPERDFSAGERSEVDRMGTEHGCHTCGTRSEQRYVPDHQPPSRLAEPGTPQRLYPQCLTCSRRQGGAVTQERRRRDAARRGHDED